MADVLTRDVRRVRLPGGLLPLGALAGTDQPHPFMPDGHTGTQCLVCFGWSNDARHWGWAALAPGGEGGS